MNIAKQAVLLISLASHSVSAVADEILKEIHLKCDTAFKDVVYSAGYKEEKLQYTREELEVVLTILDDYAVIAQIKSKASNKPSVIYGNARFYKPELLLYANTEINDYTIGASFAMDGGKFHLFESVSVGREDLILEFSEEMFDAEKKMIVSQKVYKGPCILFTPQRNKKKI